MIEKSEPTVSFGFSQKHSKGVGNMSLLQSSKVFLKRNSATILTCVGGAGVIATTVMAVHATPKAVKLLEKATEEKGEKLTKMEAVQIAGPIYIPTVITGAATIACIFGANMLNKRQQAALLSAYAVLDNSYKEYKSKVEELYGEDVTKEVQEELAKDKYEENQPTVNDNEQLFYDEFSQRYFNSTSEKVLRAEYNLNKMLWNDYGVYLNDYYELLGIDTVDYGDYLGWSSCELVEATWGSSIEFEHTKVVMDDGLECYIISTKFEPVPGFEDY